MAINKEACAECAPPPLALVAASELLKVPARPRKAKRAVHIACDCSSDGDQANAPSGTGTAPAGTSGRPACAYYAAAAAGAGARPRLYNWAEAPPVLQFNPYIRTGYRAGLGYRQCLASFFCCHNETGNILSHFLPALLTLALLARRLVEPWPHAQLEYWHNVGSILLCFALSVCYHLFSANHHSYRLWLKLDVCGVLLVLLGGGHMVLWWGFHCHPHLRAAFALVYYCAGAACVWGAVSARSSLGRAVLMLVLLLMRVAVFVVRLGVAAHPTPALWHYFAMEAYSLVGGALNALRIPERWLQPADPAVPGPLDLWLNSHQLMHACVALAMLHLHLGAAQDYHTVMAIRAGSLQCGGPGPAAAAVLP